jgi:hypothetical protein
MTTDFTPYSTVSPWLKTLPTWYPEEHRERVGSYVKYDEIYWNDPTQYALRVLEDEAPIYIPNARTVVDTTAHYLLKGLTIGVEDPEKNAADAQQLSDFLKREMFYSRFHTAKLSGVARGDFALHLTADPLKPAGTRLSLTSIDPATVIPIYDNDNLDKLVKVHIVDQWTDEDDSTKIRIRKLTYEYVIVGGRRQVQREEAIYELEPKWYGPTPKKVKVILPMAMLPTNITTIPVYWFKNLDYQGQEFGSSELRGFETLLRGISQATTDQDSALALEGLGVYATDAGRPVDDNGQETDWEVAPGKVMEVPSGAYFRRVEGVGSVKPSMDHINYLESKLREATSLSDVALGRVDVQTAQSGIALAIKFMPTLAKIEQRDQAGIDRLTQLFFDWKLWVQSYENVSLTADIVPVIGAKLPEDAKETLNELNNMLDRSVISRQYYRERLTLLGYTFPDDIEDQIQEEKTADAEIAALSAPAGLQDNAAAAAAGELPPPQSSGGAQNEPRQKGPNRSNNKKKPNESGGTEATQSARRQQRGGTPRGSA